MTHVFAFGIPAVRLGHRDQMSGRIIGFVRVVMRGRVPDARVARTLPIHFILGRHADVREGRADDRVDRFIILAQLFLQLGSPVTGAGACLRFALLFGLAEPLFFSGFALEIIGCVTV